MLSNIALVLSIMAMLLIVAGLIYCRRRSRHIPLMMGAFACDMVGLVIVEFGGLLQGGDEDPVTGLFEDTSDGHYMRVIHAALSTVAVVCYFLQIISGRKIMAGQRDKLTGHAQVAKVFLITRVLAFITMFMVR